MRLKLLAVALVLVLAASVAFLVRRERWTTVTYAVPVELAGAVVSLDGERIGVAAGQVLELRVTRDRHTLELSRPGSAPVMVTFDVSDRPASELLR